jgi:hypothetical protein
VKLTTHLHLVPRSKKNGAIPPLPQYAFMAWCLVKKAQGQLYLYLSLSRDDITVYNPTAPVLAWQY